MKIRKHYYDKGEQKVFIYENKKEEYFVIAIPDINWSIQFSYQTFDVERLILETLPHTLHSDEKEIIVARIVQWTREM